MRGTLKIYIIKDEIKETIKMFNPFYKACVTLRCAGSTETNQEIKKEGEPGCRTGNNEK